MNANASMNANANVDSAASANAIANAGYGGIVISRLFNVRSPIAVGIELSDPVTGGRATVRVLKQFAVERMYCAGDELDDAEAELIVESAEVCKCAEAGMRMLAYADNSMGRLERKLRLRGFGVEVCREAVGALVKLGYINERSQIEQHGRMLAERKLRGRRRIAAELRRMRYGSDAVAEWIEDCGIDFGAICARAIEKRGGVPERGDADGRRRLLSYLYRQGFSSEDIRRAVGIVNEADE